MVKSTFWHVLPACALGTSISACGAIVDLGAPVSLEPADAESNSDGGATGLASDGGGDSASSVPGDGDLGDGASPSLQASVIAVGPKQACAIVQVGPGSPENSTIRCWGSNGAGELGRDPAQVASSSTPLPVPLPALAGNLALAAGYACAVSTDNYLYCWGNVPADSQIRREQATPPYGPSLMDLGGSPLHQVMTASVGTDGGCCISDQSLVCWQAFAPASRIDAGLFSLDGGVTVAYAFESVAVGRAHVCGIAITNGDVQCWGANDHGQVGAPISGPLLDPTPLGLSAIAPIAQVAAGGDDSCALLNDGSVYCWGANGLGQLGDAVDSGQDIWTPTRVNLAGIATEVAIGDSHACARLESGQVWCWGDNSAAQLGIGPGAVSFRATPSKVQRVSAGAVSNLNTVQHIAAGGKTTCAIRIGNPYAWCWGDNGFGQAGQPAGAPVVPYANAVLW